MENIDLLRKKFSILQTISQAIVFTDNINAIANLMLELAISYTDAEKGSLMTVSENNTLHILAARGIESHFMRSYSLRIGEGIAGTVAQNRRAVLVEDIENDKNFKEKRRDHYKTRSFISCPVLSKDRLLGVFNINDRRDGTPFTNDEFELLKIIANHAAVAFENAFLLNQLNDKAVELEETNRRLVETDVLKTEFLTRISHELRTPLNAAKGATYCLQQNEQRSKTEQHEFQNIIATEIDKLISIVESLLNFLRFEDETRIIRKTALDIGDIFNELLASTSLKTSLKRKDIHLKIHPLEQTSEIIGDKIRVVQLFINLIEGMSHYLERNDVVEIISDEKDFVNLSILLPRKIPQNILRYLHDKRSIFKEDHPEDQLTFYLIRNIVELHRWKLLAVNTDHACRITIIIPKHIQEEIETLVNRSLDLFVDIISKTLDIDICSVMLRDELTNELTVRSAKGLDDEVIRRTRIKVGDRIAGWVALEGKPLYIEDIENDPLFAKKSISQYNRKSLISLPLKVDDQVIGVLNLNNKKTSDSFTKHDYHLASALSEKISYFLKLIYAGKYRKDEFKQFVTSLYSHLTINGVDQQKKTSFPNLPVTRGLGHPTKKENDPLT